MTTPGSHGPGEQPQGGGSGWGPPAGSSASGASQPGSVPPPPPPAAPGQYPPPQQGQYPPPQQGQYPPPQGQFGQGPGAGPGQGQNWVSHDQQKPKSGVGKWVGIAAAVLALLVVGLLALAFLGGGDPEAGDCLSEDGGELSVVDCDDEAAAFRVVGVQEGEQTWEEYQADPETCNDFADETTQSFWVGDQSDPDATSVVYCVTDAI